MSFTKIAIDGWMDFKINEVSFTNLYRLLVKYAFNKKPWIEYFDFSPLQRLPHIVYLE